MQFIISITLHILWGKNLALKINFIGLVSTCSREKCWRCWLVHKLQVLFIFATMKRNKRSEQKDENPKTWPVLLPDTSGYRTDRIAQRASGTRIFTHSHTMSASVHLYGLVARVVARHVTLAAVDARIL